MKTTNTAAYAAHAPNTSDRFALVNRPIQTANATVKTVMRPSKMAAARRLMNETAKCSGDSEIYVRGLSVRLT